MQPMVNIALRGARIAGEQIARAVERLDLIKSEQSSVSDFFEETCKQAEKAIASTIQKAYPDHEVNGEFTGQHAAESTPAITWQVNPIDSTSNFANGVPVFALSVAGYQRGRLEHAIVLNPMNGEEFTASRGRGAQCNGKRLRVSNLKTLQGALIASNYFGRNQKQHLESFQRVFSNITLEDGSIYNAGSPVLNMAYTAAGRFDGFFQFGMKGADMAAGTLLIQESGGLLSDFNGGNSHAQNGNLIVGNPKMLKALLKSIHPAVSDELK